MRYPQMLRRLFAHPSRDLRRGLEVTRAGLGQLGRPDLHGQAVLIAGTNGKGSTSALLAAALQLHGRRVGLFTSPHLVSFTERIRIDGAPITQDHAVALYQAVRQATSALRPEPSFFECTTLMAALAFREARVDVAVYEVGMGGRLDATRAVAHQLSVITRIALDHQEFLGDSLTAIAREKAGIIERFQPVIISRQRPAVRQVLAQAVAEARGCLIEAAPWPKLPPQLPSYQVDNVGTAERAAHLLGVNASAFQAALKRFQWPGRYQLIARPTPILLDGAHNADGMRAFCRALASDPRLRGRRPTVVFSALSHGDIAARVEPLRTLVDAEIVVTPCSSARSLSARELGQLLPEASRARHPRAALSWALRQARRQKERGLVVVVGSLYLVGDILTHLGQHPPEKTVDG